MLRLRPWRADGPCGKRADRLEEADADANVEIAVPEGGGRVRLSVDGFALTRSRRACPSGGAGPPA